MTPDELRARKKRVFDLTKSLARSKRRAAVQDDLVKFVHTIAPEIVPARFHLEMAERLMALERGEITRLGIFMPPGHGKSSWSSIWFPAWYLGRNPWANIITASHTDDLAKKWSRRVRGIMSCAEYGQIFDTRISPETSGSSEWETTELGGYIAAGVTGAISGRRAARRDRPRASA